jgi:hypothetical protein
MPGPFRLLVAINDRQPIAFIKWIEAQGDYEKIYMKAVKYGHQPDTKSSRSGCPFVRKDASTEGERREQANDRSAVDISPRTTARSTSGCSQADSWREGVSWTRATISARRSKQ